MRFRYFIPTAMREFRLTARSLARSPAFTASTVLTLALAIGANTAIFSLVNVVLIRPLPVRSPRELVELLHQYPSPGEPRINGFPMEIYRNLRTNSRTLSSVIAIAGRGSFSVRKEGADPERVDGRYVSGNYFEALGLRPALGRLLRPEDDAWKGAAPNAVTVLSFSSWRARFRADPNIIGTHIVVETLPVTVVGIAPPGFDGVQIGRPAEFWLALSIASQIELPGRPPGAAILGRLSRGTSIQTAFPELEHLYRQGWSGPALARDPNLRRMQFYVEPAGNGIGPVKDSFGKPLSFLMAAAGLLLLLACSNLATVLAARGEARKHDLAIRASLGLSPARLLRLVLLECLMLAFLGAALGTLLAWLGSNALVRIIATARPHERFELSVPLDATVLAFMAAISVLATLLFGLAPARNAMRSFPAALLRGGARLGSSAREHSFAKVLVIAQVAMSVVLLSAATLFARHLFNLRHQNLGFDPERLLIVTLDPSQSGLDDPRRSNAYQDLLAALRGLPGVESATLSGATPISGAAASRFVIAEGFNEDPNQRRHVSLNWVAPDFFSTYQTPVLVGREFEARDRSGQQVAIINRAMMKYYFPDRSPVGMHLQFVGQEISYEIIGVVTDAKYTELRSDPPRTCYLPAFRQDSVLGNEVSIRTAIPAERMLPEFRSALRDTADGVHIAKTTSLSGQMDAAIVPERLMSLLSRLFGAIGLLLTTIGLYGVLQNRVARRVREIGIRMAVGAARTQVSWMVCKDAIRLVSVGLMIGLGISLWTQQLAARIVEGMPDNGTALILVGGSVVISFSVLATAIPAWRAAAINPVESLRAE